MNFIAHSAHIQLIFPSPDRLCPVLNTAFALKPHWKILPAVSVVIKVLDSRQHESSISLLMQGICVTLMHNKCQHIGFIDDNSDLISSFIDLVSVQIEQAPLTFVNYCPETIEMIFSILNLSMKVQDKWVLKSVIVLLIKILNFNQDIKIRPISIGIMNQVAESILLETFKVF